MALVFKKLPDPPRRKPEHVLGTVRDVILALMKLPMDDEVYVMNYNFNGDEVAAINGGCAFAVVGVSDPLNGLSMLYYDGPEMDADSDDDLEEDNDD